MFDNQHEVVTIKVLSIKGEYAEIEVVTISGRREVLWLGSQSAIGGGDVLRLFVHQSEAIDEFHVVHQG